MRLLLDTSALIFFARGDERMSRTALAHLQDSDNSVFVSAVSGWEIGLKHALGKLDLPQPPRPFLADVFSRLDFDTIELDLESSLRATELPMLHRDPFDRLLVGQSLTHGLVVVTCDPMFARYGASVVW